MYRESYQRGMLTIFFSVGSKPLKIWDTHTQDGYISRFLDQDIKSMVLEIGGTNVSTTYMICPKGNTVLGITMPFLVMVVKNLKKYFSFEVTILDDTGTRRRFRVSNFQSTTQILPLCTVMPIGLTDGWNQIQFNLAEFTRRAYKKQFVEVQKLKVNANIRLRRIYFAERIVPEDQLPAEYKLFFPLKPKRGKDKKTTADIAPTAPEEAKSVSVEQIPTVTKSTGVSKSLQVLKTPSQLAEDDADERPSRLIEIDPKTIDKKVAEQSMVQLDRHNAETTVPVITDLSSSKEETPVGEETELAEPMEEPTVEGERITEGEVAEAKEESATKGDKEETETADAGGNEDEEDKGAAAPEPDEA